MLFVLTVSSSHVKNKESPSLKGQSTLQQIGLLLDKLIEECLSLNIKPDNIHALFKAIQIKFCSILTTYITYNILRANHPSGTICYAEQTGFASCCSKVIYVNHRSGRVRINLHVPRIIFIYRHNLRICEMPVVICLHKPVVNSAT